MSRCYSAPVIRPNPGGCPRADSYHRCATHTSQSPAPDAQYATSCSNSSEGDNFVGSHRMGRRSVSTPPPIHAVPVASSFRRESSQATGRRPPPGRSASSAISRRMRARLSSSAASPRPSRLQVIVLPASSRPRILIPRAPKRLATSRSQPHCLEQHGRGLGPAPA